MRTFACFTTESGAGAPALSFIFAADEARARELALRELMEAVRPARIEVYENDLLLFVEDAPLEAERTGR
jgi:hypothetical protein